MRRFAVVLLTTGLAIGVGSCEETIINVPEVVSLAIEPAEPSVHQDQDLQLSVVLHDGQGRVLKDRVVEWSVDDTGIATVSTDGSLRGVAVGETTVHATSEGATTSAPVTIPNRPPSATLLDPVGTEPILAGTDIRFRGQGSDPEDGVLLGDALTWASSLDGPIGSDTAFTGALSPGEHVIRLTVADAHGATAADSVAVLVHQAPAVAITAPPNGAAFLEGDEVQFHGTATDAEDGPLSGPAVEWTSSLDGLIGTDTVFSTPELSVGEHMIHLTASDQQGVSARDSIMLIVEQNQGPTAAIIDPADGSTFDQGDAITFRAVASDTEDGPLSGASVVWTSSIDGQIGTDTVFTNGSLSAGQHVIRVTATDGHGDSHSDSVQISVNAAPTVAVIDPIDGTVFTEGETILFHATATDPEDGPLAGPSVVWSSSIDGQIGTDSILTTAALSAGDHMVRVTATDARGLTATDSVFVPVNSTPTAAIVRPADGSTFTETLNVTFRGSASDAEDGALAGPSVEWTSSLDGPIGQDTVLTTSTLSLGDHVIRMIASDGDGATATDSVLVTVRTPDAAISESWATWWDATGHLTMVDGSAGSWLSAAAFQHSSSWLNFGMVQYSAIPRIATINDTADARYGFLAFPYDALTDAAWQASRGLRALLVNGVDLGAGDQERALAFGKFVLGLSHGYLAMLYQTAPLVDESTTSGSPPAFTGFDALDDAALSYLDEAIAYAQSAAFTIPEDWMWVSGGVSNDRLVRIIHSFKARIMAAVPRSPTARDNADWAAIVSELDAGITQDLHYTFNSSLDRWNATLYYTLEPSFGWTNYFVHAMADTSGNYQTWMALAVDDRLPYLNGDTNQPFLIHTPDTRFPQGGTLEEQVANPGTRLQALSSPTWAEPGRGTWRWSYYADVRDADATAANGSSPDLTLDEMNLLRAEGYFRWWGDMTAVADIVNVTRTAAGLPATDAGGSNGVCVPRMPNGACGDLWEMLKYEKRMVASHNNGHMSAGWYFDSRGWGDLPEGTILTLPLPAHVALEHGFTVENYGGVGGVWGAPVGTYGY